MGIKSGRDSHINLRYALVMRLGYPFILSTLLLIIILIYQIRLIIKNIMDE